MHQKAFREWAPRDQLLKDHRLHHLHDHHDLQHITDLSTLVGIAP